MTDNKTNKIKKKRTILINILIICIILLCRIVIMASDDGFTILIPDPNIDPHLELRAYKINEFIDENGEKNKQVKMQLWTNKMDFERI